jgi:large repetitive protein
MEQRLVGLTFSAAGTTLTVSGPPNASIAPPGYYMLFILNNQGVPSIAKFVQVLSTPNNQPPTGTITQPTGNVTIAAGQAVTFAGSGFDPDGAPAQFAWVLPGGSPGSVLNNPSPGSVTFANPGTYVASLTVVDSIGENDPSPPTRTITVTGASNQPPTANPGGPYTGTAGQAIAFNGSGSSDPDGQVVSYQWSFGDGGTATGATPSHTYANGGSYMVSLAVTDNNGAVGSASTTANVAAPNNQLPVARFVGSPYSGTTLTAIAFNGSTSSDPDGTIASYAWNFGDGNTATGATLTTPNHTYGSAGTYTVTLTVTDDKGGQGSATTTATVANRLPTANPGGSYSGITLTAIAFDGSASSDPDGTIATYSWDFGDLSTASGAKPSHTYTSSGTYTVRLTVTDDKGGSASASTTATVANRLPTANAGGPYSGGVGQAVAFDGSASSDPDGTIASYAWNFGDGSTATGATLVRPNHTYANAGTYTVTLSVIDNNGAQSSTSATTTATIVPPPSAPTALVVQRNSKSKATLTWADNSDNETGFKIERSADGTTFTEIATVGANVTTYQDSSVNKAYYYRVRAYNSAGNSGYSNTYRVTPP